MASARRPQRRPRHHAGRICALRRHWRGDSQHPFHSHPQRQRGEHRRRGQRRRVQSPSRPPPVAPRRPCAPTTRRSARKSGSKISICLASSRRWTPSRRFASHEAVRLLLVTGGPGAVKAAMQTGKRAICAGPGNPPVLVDDTCCLTRAAKSVIQGAAYDNNLLCIGEKQVFVLDHVADELMAEMGQARRGAAEFQSTGKAHQSRFHFRGRAGRRRRARRREPRFHRPGRIGPGSRRRG